MDFDDESIKRDDYDNEERSSLNHHMENEGTDNDNRNRSSDTDAGSTDSSSMWEREEFFSDVQTESGSGVSESEAESRKRAKQSRNDRPTSNRPVKSWGDECRYSEKDVTLYKPGEKLTYQLNKKLIVRWERNPDWADELSLQSLFSQDCFLFARILIIGKWTHSSKAPNYAQTVMQVLNRNAARLSNLTAICFGDIPKRKLANIQLCNITPLLQNFKYLTVLKIRGTGLSLNSFPSNHSLRLLIIETACCSSSVIKALTQIHFSALETLELWLGDSGVITSIQPWQMEDITTLANAQNMPQLTRLGLRNSEESDEVVERLFQGTLIRQLRSLDLSLGTVGDAGLEVIMKNIKNLSIKEINLCHNYCTASNLYEFCLLCAELSITAYIQDTKQCSGTFLSIPRYGEDVRTPKFGVNFYS